MLSWAAEGCCGNKLNLMTKRLSFFFFFLSPHCTNTTVTHRFTMTITSAPRNHGNIELINSRIEELLVHVVHAAFLFMRMKLAQGLQRFVSDVLGYINLLASYSPLPPIPPSPIPSPVHGCVHVCSCACLLTFSIHSPERGRRGRAKTIPTFFPKASCLPCLLHFFFSRHFFLNKILFFRSPTHTPTLRLVFFFLCQIVCTEADQGFFLQDAGSCLRAPFCL